MRGQTCGSDPDLPAHFLLTGQYIIPGLSQHLLLCGRAKFRPAGLTLSPFLVILFSTEERRAREWPLETADLPEVHLEDWLEKRAKRLSSAPSSRYGPRILLPFLLGKLSLGKMKHLCDLLMAYGS